MAAASYFHSALNFQSEEETLEVQAAEIEHGLIQFQARLRGFISRQSIILHKEQSVSIKAGRSRDISVNYSDGPYLQRKGVYARDPWGIERSEATKSVEPYTLYRESIGNLNETSQKTRKDFLERTSFSKGQTAYVKAASTIPPESVQEIVAHWHTEVAPWWIKNPLDSEEGELCSICRHINFDALLHTTNAQESKIPLGLLETIAKKFKCPFCRLVTHTGFFELDVNVDSLASLPINIYCELCGDIRWNQYATRIRALCLKFTVTLPDKHDSTIVYGWIQEILPSGKRPPEQSRNDSRLMKDQIDFKLVKSWIAACKEQHHSINFEPNNPLETSLPNQSGFILESCQPILRSTMKGGLTLIDVQKECLVNLPITRSYLALSYVWGGPQSFQNTISKEKSLYVPHSLSLDNRAIPLTIRDAIQLVRNLGERYLWVDSLCICQDKIEDKASQIMNMGNVYRGALLTIIAASGNHANVGLPGVRAFSRNHMQRAECVQGMTLVNELPPLKDIIEKSFWNTRCWTYQENLLSKRFLLFCKTHVFFQCNQVTFKEDSGVRNVAVNQVRATKIRAERLPIWNSYRRAVTEYTKRTLSDESDAVNAFQGITDLLQPALKGDFLFGLPEIELDIALLWQPVSLMSRRVDPTTKKPLFPSWSWAGWVGSIKYIWSRHQIDDVSRVEWQCTDLDNGSSNFYTSDDLRAPKDNDHDSWEYVPNPRGAPYYYRRKEPDIWCLHPVVPKERRHSVRLLQPGSHHLIFKAYTTRFRISSTSCNFFGIPRTINSHITHPLAIFGPDGFVAGEVLIPSYLLNSIASTYQEFVCLSRRRYDEYDRAPPPQDDDFEHPPVKAVLYPYESYQYAAAAQFDLRRYNKHKPWPLYNVMMIRQENGVAERLALGVVHVTAFMQARPVRKIVTLA